MAINKNSVSFSVNKKCNQNSKDALSRLKQVYKLCYGKIYRMVQLIVYRDLQTEQLI